MTIHHLIGLLVSLILFNVCLILLRLLLGWPFWETALLAVLLLSGLLSVLWQGWLRCSTGS